jgi:hypothetical protein
MEDFRKYLTVLINSEISRVNKKDDRINPKKFRVENAEQKIISRPISPLPMYSLIILPNFLFFI